MRSYLSCQIIVYVQGNDCLQFHGKNSLTKVSLFQHSLTDVGRGFQSINEYLLAAHESVYSSKPPNPGPTISDNYFPDDDRHFSGLICFAKDHCRGVVEKDVEITPLQTKQDKADYLTDSESDNDDDYHSSKPSTEHLKSILNPPKKIVEDNVDMKKDKKDKKGKKDTKGEQSKANENVKVDQSFEDDAFSVLHEDQRKEEQVELLRDRMTLDLEGSVWKGRKANFDDVSHRYLSCIVTL